MAKEQVPNSNTAKENAAETNPPEKESAHQGQETQNFTQEQKQQKQKTILEQGISKILGTQQAKEVQSKQTNDDKIKELTETLQRLQAEFENSQKRNTKQNNEFAKFANAKIIEEILPVLDSLEHGIKHNPEFLHIYEQLFSILRKKGLSKVPAEQGMRFNHETMECMLQEKNPKLAEDDVASVLITGYLLNGKVLRPVKVSVNVLGKENKECEPKETTKSNSAEEKAAAASKEENKK